MQYLIERDSDGRFTVQFRPEVGNELEAMLSLCSESGYFHQVVEMEKREDGGRRFELRKVPVKAAEAKKPDDKQAEPVDPNPAGVTVRDQYTSMSNAELERLLAERGISVAKGSRRPELLDRARGIV